MFLPSKLEVALLHVLLRRAKLKLVRVFVHVRGEFLVLLLAAEVTLDDVKRLLVDVLVLVALQEFNFVESWKGAGV